MSRGTAPPIRIPGEIGTRVALAVTLLLALVVTATPARGQSSGPADVALVRFIHASPDAPAVDIYVDERLVVEGAAFAAVTDYLPVEEGDRTVSVVPTGGTLESQTVVDLERAFEPDTFVLVAVTGYLNDLAAQAFEVEIDPLDESGTARLRAIHLSPDAGELDIFQLGGDELFGAVEFLDPPSDIELVAGTYDLEVRRDEDDTVALTVPGVALAAGFTHDLLLLGEARTGSLAALTLVTPANQPCGTVIGIGTNEDGCVRVLHASPDTPAVDVYVDDIPDPVLAGLAFGSAGDYLPLSDGNHEIRVVPAGGNPEEPVADIPLDVDAGEAVLVTALDKLEDLTLETYEIDLSPVGGQQTRIRALHAIPGFDAIDLAASGTILFEDVAFEDETDYDLVTAGTYDLEVRPTGDPAAVIGLTGVTFEPGRVYDLVAIGGLDGGELGILVLVSPAPNTIAIPPAPPAPPPPRPRPAPRP